VILLPNPLERHVGRLAGRQGRLAPTVDGERLRYVGIHVAEDVRQEIRLVREGE